MTVHLPMRFEDQPLLWTVEDVYSEHECAEFIAFIEASAPGLATSNPMYRDQDRVMKDDAAAAADLFERLKPHLPARIGPYSLVGLNERFRFYRYRQGQQFQPHMDHWYRPCETRITLHTVLVYFNGDFEGGQTRFYEQVEETITPKPGLAAVFQHKIRHEGRPARRGTKYALRTDTIYEASDVIGSVTPSF